MANNSVPVEKTSYNTAKLWQIILFTLNNSSTNIYLFAFGFVTYYSTGFIGLTALFVSQLLGYIRIFDGFIDPAIGVLIDKTNTKWGKYRPIIVLGNIITVISFIMLFNTHLIEGPAKSILFIIALIVHKTGYSLQATVTKAGQAALTNDPNQRPIFNIVDGFATTLLFTGGQIIVANFLTPMFGGFTLEFFRVFITGIMIISAILGILAIIGISEKDNQKYFGIGENTKQTSMKDYWTIIKGNRPLQMLSMAAAFVKLNAQMFSDQVVLMIVFGIIFGDFGLSGIISLILIVPNLLFTTVAANIARKKGLRYSYVKLLQGSVLFLAALALLLFFSNPGDLSLSNITIKGILFIVTYTLARGFTVTPSGLALTMAADVSDYETSKSGQYVSGMLGTMFSLTDSVASSFAPMMVGWALVAIGFGDAYPTAETALSMDLRIVGVLLIAVIPLLGSLAALGFMKFYALDKEKMVEVQLKIAEMKEKGFIDGDDDPAETVEGNPQEAVPAVETI